MMSGLLVHSPLTDTNETFDGSQSHNSAVEYAVVHRLAGRLRLKIPCLAGDEDYARRLQRLVLKTTVITENRINTAAASVIVAYDWETTMEAVILDALETIIQAARQTAASESSPPAKEQDFGLPLLAMITAVVASPLELPFFVVGGLILVASVPLWQRVGREITHDGEMTVDSLDALWLTAQLIQGNGIAGALALNLAQVGETLRQDRLEQLENELYVLFEREDRKIPPLSEQQHFAPVQLTDRWVQSIEETELMQQVKPLARSAIVPTLLLSSLTGILTQDLGRASAWLPLDLGVSLRGVTPLAVVSALTAAARSGVYIRNGRTLEQLAQVDSLVFSSDSFQSLTTELDLFSLVQSLKMRSLDLHIVTQKDRASLQSWAENLGISANNLHLVSESREIEEIIRTLQDRGHKVAWIDDDTSDALTATTANVVISLARGEQESRADVILHSHDLRSLAATLTLARHTLSTAYASLTIALVPNLVAVGAGVVFGLDPIIAVAINSGSAILAELNSLRPIRDRV